MTQAIEVSGIEKTFVKKRSIRQLMTHPFRRAERVPALRGVDLAVAEGEIFGLLGPNGAGKTTLLKILSCLVLPDKGSAKVLGFDTRAESRVKPLIGLVHADERSFYWRLTGRENLRFFARLYNIPGPRIGPRIKKLLELVDMTDAAARPFSDYSSGMKQRIAIARALLHDPPVLFMDEPTRSLDPTAALSLRSFILERLRDRDGKTILLATHNLREAETMADRVAILVQGRVREVGTVDRVRRWGLRERCFSLELAGGPGELAGPFDVLSDERADDRRSVIVSLHEGVGFEDLLRSLLDAGWRVLACDRDEPDLERAFERITGSDGEPA